MPLCKFCARPVLSSPVWHDACWEREMERFAETFCDHFCRWPDACGSEEELLEQHCEKDCPMLRLLNAGL